MGMINTDDPVALTVNGKSSGRDAALPVAIDRTADANSAPGLPLMWARAQVTDLTRDLSLGTARRRYELDDEQLIEEITALGLDFSLVTPYTSFVAVSVNQRPLGTVDADVPLPMVKGVGPLAYPQTTQFTGTAAPEPPLMLMALLFGLYAAVMGLWRKLRGRRSSALPRHPSPDTGAGHPALFVGNAEGIKTSGPRHPPHGTTGL